MTTEPTPRKRGSAKGNVLRMPAADSTAAQASREDEIARRAYEIYQARGGEPGREFDDWLQAEREVNERQASGRQAS